MLPNEARDFHTEFEQNTDIGFDLIREYGAVGLDLSVFNVGSASCTVRLDNGTVITVGAGTSRSWDNIKFSTVYVDVTDTVQVLVAGVYRDPSKLRVGGDEY